MKPGKEKAQTGTLSVYVVKNEMGFLTLESFLV
jgi:hypothetical protein